MAPGGRGECQRLPRKGRGWHPPERPSQAPGVKGAFRTGLWGRPGGQQRAAGRGSVKTAARWQCQGRGSCLSLLVSKLSWKCGFYVKILDF